MRQLNCHYWLKFSHFHRFIEPHVQPGPYSGVSRNNSIAYRTRLSKTNPLRVFLSISLSYIAFEMHKIGGSQGSHSYRVRVLKTRTL